MNRRLFTYLICLAALAPRPAALAAALTELEARGKQLYLTGVDNAGPEPKAYLGAERLPVPARLAACGSCHGEDGRGRPEGNIAPSDVTWDRLTDGRAAQAGELAESIISNAVAQGVGRNGKRLDAIMPRYALSEAQMQALQKYLKVISTDQAPGVTSDTIRVAIILPAKETAQAYDAMRQISLVYFEKLNARGGVFNRRVDAVTFDADETLDTLKRRIENREFLALVVLDAGPRGAEVARLADETATPSIAASAVLGASTSRSRFSIFPDIATQMRVLVDFVAQAPKRSPRIALVHAKDETPTTLRDAIERQFAKWDIPKPIEIVHAADAFDARATVANLSRASVDGVIFPNGGEFAAFFEALKQTDWRPKLLIPSSVIGPALLDAPADISANIFFSLPLLAEQSASAAEFQALRETSAILRRHAASQVAAYCASLILTEGLKLSGRDISRTKFVASLENLRDFDTGVSHQVSFDSNRHVGNDGAYIFNVEASARRFRMVSDWRAPR